jgi:hypothetical protein
LSTFAANDATEFGVAAVVVEVEFAESVRVVTPYTPPVVAVPDAPPDWSTHSAL